MDADAGADEVGVLAGADDVGVVDVDVDVGAVDDGGSVELLGAAVELPGVDAVLESPMSNKPRTLIWWAVRPLLRRSYRGTSVKKSIHETHARRRRDRAGVRGLSIEPSRIKRCVQYWRESRESTSRGL